MGDYDLLKHLNYTKFILSLFATLILSGCTGARLLPWVRAQVLPKAAIKVLNYCATSGYSYSDTFATNLSSKMANEKWLEDFDRDGLTDSVESDSLNQTTYGILPTSAYSTGTDYTDLSLFTLGILAASDPSLSQCLFPPTQDSDYDNLTDCDEAILHTDRFNPDSDGDGIPDGLEVRNSTNPLDANDSTSDPDLDGLTNLEEIKMNTPISFTNSPLTTALALNYSITQVLDDAQGNNCYNITVRNFPILPESNGNLLRIFVIENKTVVNSGVSQNIQTLTVVLPQTTEDQSMVVANGLNNQTLDGTSTPLTIVPVD